jgi:hypothetical protein
MVYAVGTTLTIATAVSLTLLPLLTACGPPTSLPFNDIVKIGLEAALQVLSLPAHTYSYVLLHDPLLACAHLLSHDDAAAPLLPYPSKPAPSPAPPAPVAGHRHGGSAAGGGAPDVGADVSRRDGFRRPRRPCPQGE